ncbi:hypothetical protein HK405_013000, partial [Cladochytrium tenue]
TVDQLVTLNKAYDPTFSCNSLSAGQVICLSDDADSSSTADPTSTTGTASTSAASSTATASPGCKAYITSQAGADCSSLSESFACNYAYTQAATQMYYFQLANPTLNCLLTPVTAGTQICESYVFASASTPQNSPTPVDACTALYVVRDGDSCESIAAAYNITTEDLYSINVYMTCLGLSKYVGSAICVDVPGLQHALSTTTSSEQATTATAADAAPSSSTTEDAATTTTTTSMQEEEPTPTPTTTSSDDVVADPTPTPTPTTTSSDAVVADPSTSTTTTEDPPQTSTSSETPSPSAVTNPCKSCGVTYDQTLDYGTLHDIGLYGLPGVTKDSGLEADATSSLNYYQGAARACGDLTHDGNDLAAKNEGENLAWFGSTDQSIWTSGTIGSGIVSWMQEDSLYFLYSDGGTNPSQAWTYAAANGEEVGHFTQMVWSSSTTVGCATRTCSSSG